MIKVRDKVRFVETDMMGVVHHSNYFRWFEMGRVEYLKAAGIYLLDLMANDIVFPITDVSCQYKASARFDDYFLVETCMAELSRAKMVFTYRVVREADGLLLATGRTQNLFTDSKGKVIRLPAKYYDPLRSVAQADLTGADSQ
ncbi:acyl-CoA thioesterase [Acetonema longum]|uniref:Thioesterase superfamily protein n=1 Tax=Acetonema longum DSM 6540 TaxID=1009370 RepID=F7NEK5_9FIRM|nr:thioesterase family protein [Acetonema longum]EGO65416.1 thioesterase superfamily protein [Acetonema longum DSM 6540]